MSSSHATRRMIDTTAALLIAMALLAAGLVLLPTGAQAASYGDMGSKVAVGSSDFVPTLTATLPVAGAFLGYRQVTVDYRAWYLHLGAAADTAAAQGASFRLNCGTSDASCPTNAQAGKWVRAGDPDLALPNYGAALVAFAARVRYLESDGRPGWTAGDGLYADVSNNGAATGTLQAGDVRIIPPTGFTCTTCPKGAVVRAGDTDLAQVAVTTAHPLNANYAAGVFDFLWFNGHNDGQIGFADVFYLKGPSAPTHSGQGTNSVHPDINDARLTELSSNLFTGTVEFASLVTSTSPDYKHTLTTITPGVGVANAADPDLTDQHLFMVFTDPDGTTDHIKLGDVQLYRGPSGGSSGTLVTAKGGDVATSPGQATGITFTAGMTGLLRFHDLHSNGYGAVDPIYMKRPGNAAGTVEIGDLRITARSEFSPALAAGTVVKAGDPDIGDALTASANLRIKRFDSDGGNEVKLNALTQIFKTGANARWDPTTEGLYLCSAGTPTTVGDAACTGTMTRLFHPTAGGNMAVVNCPGDADCATAVSSYTGLSVTGADSTFDAASSEYIYDRTVATRLTVGDQRVNAQGALPFGDNGGIPVPVAAGDADITSPHLTSSDYIVVTWDPLGTVPFMRVGDVFIAGSTFGTRVTHTTTGFVPILTEYATEAAGNLFLARLNRGDTSAATDDTLYATFTAAASLGLNDIRATPITQTLRAGTLIKTGDSTFVQEVGGSAAVTVDANRITTRLCHIDVDARAGLSLNDPLYIMAAGLGVPFNADATRINPLDVRVTPYPATGTKSHEPGTFVQAGNVDLTSGQVNCGAKPAGLTWHFRYFDQNYNQAFDSSGAQQTDDDVGYFALGTTLNHAPPPLHAVRFTGPGGAQSSTADPSTGGGGGGGGTPPPTGPSLSSGSVSPEFVTVTQNMVFRVYYAHGQNTAPTTRNLVVDGQTFQMATTGTPSSYTTSVEYTYVRGMPTAGEIPFHFEFSDGTTTVRFPTTGSLTAYVGPSTNAAPAPSAGSPPTMTGAPGDSFTFEFIYKDANNNAPQDAKVHLEWNPTEEHDLTCSGTEYYKGVTCSTTVTLTAEGSYRYHFTVSDGTTTSRYPATGTLEGPVVSAAPTTPPDDGDDGDDGDDNGTPGPAIAIVLTALGLLVWRARRRR